MKNQKAPGRAAELNYQENTVARGSRKDTASICHTLTVGKESAGSGGGLGGRLESEREKKFNWKKNKRGGDRMNRVWEDVRISSNHVLFSYYKK